MLVYYRYQKNYNPGGAMITSNSIFYELWSENTQTFQLEKVCQISRETRIFREGTTNVVYSYIQPWVQHVFNLTSQLVSLGMQFFEY